MFVGCQLCIHPNIRSKGEQQARGTLVWKEIWAGDLEGAAALTLTARMKR